MKAIQLLLVIVGAEGIGFSSRFVTMGHPAWIFGTILGTILLFLGLLLPIFRR